MSSLRPQGTDAFQQRTDKSSPPQFYHLEFIRKFSTGIRHISGQDNVVVGVPSRSNSVSAPFDYNTLAVYQEHVAELQELLKESVHSSLERVYITGGDITLYSNTSTQQRRLFITTPFKLHIFDSVHNLSHRQAGIPKVLWPGMQTNSCTWTCACTPYKCTKVCQQVRGGSLLGRFKLRSASSAHMHMDLVEPLPISSRFPYSLTAVDSRSPEAVPLAELAAELVGKVCVAVLVTRFNCP